MLAAFVTILFVLVGLVNFVPLVGVLGGERLQSAYGITLNSPELEVLMRHRAVLFGIIGGFILASAFIPDWRRIASVMAAVSMVSYIVLVKMHAVVGPALMKLSFIDSVAVVFLVMAVAEGCVSASTGGVSRAIILCCLLL